MQKFLAFGVSPENPACGTEFRGSRAPAALPGEPFHLVVCLSLSEWLLLSQDGNPMDAPWMVKLNSTSTRCFSLIYSRMLFYLVPAFFSAGYPAGWRRGGPTRQRPRPRTFSGGFSRRQIDRLKNQ